LLLNKVLIYCKNGLLAKTLTELLQSLPDISQAVCCTSLRDIVALHTSFNAIVIDDDTNLYKDFCRRKTCLPVLLTEDESVKGEQVFIKPLKFDDFANRFCRLLADYNHKKETEIKIKNLLFFPVQRLLFNADKTKSVKLTEKEAEILFYLYKAKGQKADKTKMLQDVWGYGENITTHTLQTHIYRLRLKTEKLSDKSPIHSTENGYRLCL